MTRTLSVLCCALLGATGCGENNRQATDAVDCAAADGYEFRNISDFSAGTDGWFRFADNTPGGVPDPADSKIAPPEVAAPGRCGDTSMIELKASGHNFYGAGFGEWDHSDETVRADGTGFEGISFWARSAINTDKTFQLTVDDGRTLVAPPPFPPPPAPAPAPGELPVATAADQDLDGDGFVGAGDIARGTRCRLPPDPELGRVACYYGGALPPAGPTRVPEVNECGNHFHTYVTTTDEWQLFFLPWDRLVQWPCQNRLEGGIDHADIAQLQLTLVQGTSYDIWLDNIAFYRLRANAGL